MPLTDEKKPLLNGSDGYPYSSTPQPGSGNFFTVFLLHNVYNILTKCT